MGTVRQSSRRWRRPALGFGLVGAGAGLALLLTQAVGSTPPPAPPGNAFPDLAGLKAVNGDGELDAFDLGVQGRDQFLLIFYWVAGHIISEDSLVDMRDWVDQHQNVTLVSVVPPRGKTPAQVGRRAAQLGLEVPIVWDEGYKVQATVRAGQVPHITVVDPSRVVRVVGAASPRHEITAGMTLAQYLDRAVAGKGHPTVTSLPRYYPVTELIDRPYADFTLGEVLSRKALRFADQIADGKLTLLVFWSPDCSHCKIELPELNAYFQRHRQRLNIVGIVKVKDAGFQQRTADFIRLHDLQFPTVGDRLQEVWNRYKIVTTPTTIVVSPDGRVDTVLLGSAIDLEKELGPRIARLAAGPPGA